MLVTTINFIGLLIITNLTGSGAQVVMGHVPGMMPKHDSIIAYQPASLKSETNWPKDGSFTAADGTVYDYVRVNQENVTFAGPTDPFVNDIGNTPHLSCCCATMTGIRPEYGDKDQSASTKASAHFLLDHGLFSTIEEPDKAVTSLLTFADPTDLIINGALPNGTTKRQLVLKFPAQVLVANTPIAALEGKMATDPNDDFLAYYNMGIASATCTRAPMDSLPNPCRPAPTPCNVAAAKAKSTRAKLNEKLAEVRASGIKKAKNLTFITDMNCSNSSWP
jgi:hypothetical protein